MKLTAKLAYSQIKATRARTVWTLAGIALSTMMITAVFGFAASGNSMLNEVMGENDYYTNIYNAALAGMSAIFVTVIVVASVIVVSNAFRVSAGQRFSQFGILKSVGATKKQIAETILYEGVLLCVAGIPVGIVLGLLVNLAGIQIANFLLSDLNSINSNTPLVLHFVLAWQAVILSIVVAFATVLLSAWLPARKAAKTPAIEAIRGVGEVKIKTKRVRSNWLVSRLFGVEGTLASKSLKRSRRNFRATVVSLTVSVVLLITVGYFGEQMNAMTSAFFPGVDANVVGEFFSNSRTTYGGDDVITRRRYTAINSGLANEITEKLREYPDVAVFGAGADYHSYVAYIPAEMLTQKMYEALGDFSTDTDAAGQIRLSVTFIVTDAENYAVLCSRAGVPLGSNILVNQFTNYVEGGRTVFAPLVFSKRALQIVNLEDETEFSLPLHAELAIGSIPDEVLLSGNSVATIIVPQLEALQYRWIAKADDADGFAEYLDGVLSDMLEFDEELGRTGIINIEESIRATRGFGNLIMVFVYGFVIMLTLIGLTNVISTISANVRSRSREFAILRSVGMTQGGLGRMLNLESILCSMKSLIFGVPLGVLGSYLVYNALELPVELPYTLPWMPIAHCVIGVFAITWVVMRYSASRLRGRSIVEAIRKEAF